MTNNDGTPRSTEMTFDIMRTETAYINEANLATQKGLMNSNTVDAMADALMSHSSFVGLATAENSTYIRSIASTSALTQSVLEMSKPGGYCEIVTRSRLDRATLPTIKIIDIGKLIAEYTNKQKDAEAAVEARLKDRQSLVDRDPRVAQADKEPAVAEEEQEKTGKDVDEAKVMWGQVEHEKEREEEFKKKEGEEVDRVFGKGKGGPREGVTAKKVSYPGGGGFYDSLDVF